MQSNAYSHNLRIYLAPKNAKSLELAYSLSQKPNRWPMILDFAAYFWQLLPAPLVLRRWLDPKLISCASFQILTPPATRLPISGTSRISAAFLKPMDWDFEMGLYLEATINWSYAVLQWRSRSFSIRSGLDFKYYERLACGCSGKNRARQ